MTYEIHPADCRHEPAANLEHSPLKRAHNAEHLAQLERQTQLLANQHHLDHLYQLDHTEHPASSLFNLHQQHYLTIEDIKSTRNSCWLCGCNWLEDHVSLDCPECGGYALSRPCPSCDGQCQQRWTRNISATHDRHKALWVGQCKFQKQTAATFQSESERFKAAARLAASMISTTNPTAQQQSQATCSGGGSLAPSSCCSSLPSSAAASDEEPDEPK